MIYAENILICIAAPLVVALLFVRGNARTFVLSFLVGMGICLISAYIGGFAGHISGYGEETTAIYLSPMIEETMKLLPLLIFLFFFTPDDTLFILVAVAVGTGFATFENCCYILSAGAESLPYVLVRGLAVGVMHVVSILSLSFALIMARRLKVLSFSGVAGGLTFSMTFHGLYNLLVSQPGISSTIGYTLPVATAILLLLFYRHFQTPPQGE